MTLDYLMMLSNGSKNLKEMINVWYLLLINHLTALSDFSKKS